MRCRYVQSGLLYPQLDRRALQAQVECVEDTQVRQRRGDAERHAMCRTTFRERPCRTRGNVPCFLVPLLMRRLMRDLTFHPQALRDQLPGLGLVAFVGDGSILPRCAPRLAWQCAESAPL